MVDELAVAGALERPDRRPASEVLEALGVDPDAGLNHEAAQRRLEQVGRNELPTPRPPGLAARIARGLRDPMSMLLLAAAALSGLVLGEVVDAAAIAMIVAANVGIGLVEEGRAESALAALRALAVPDARGRREGSVLTVPAAELVPGDLVPIEAGDRVPADLRLVWAHGLEVDEALLTGESLPAVKDPARLSAQDATLGERPAMLYSGTFAVRGMGLGVVVATGPRTVFGRIAQQVTAPRRLTPLQGDLAQVTRRLGIASVVIGAVVLGLTLARSGTEPEALHQAFLVAVALAVAAVPEGLATITAVALAIGVRRMAEHGAIIRRLPAVETLGSATVIVVDKTGTLTQNQMAFEAVAPPDARFEPLDALAPHLREPIERITALCSDATLDPPVGDPTELALIAPFGARRISELRIAWPRLGEAPFDAERKRMVTVHQPPVRSGSGYELCIKGAPETVLPRCTRALTAAGAAIQIDDRRRRDLAQQVAWAAEQGMRILALARRPLDSVPADPDAAAVDLELVAFVGLRDPVRPSAQRSVAEARRAGITVLMATGDHPGTAQTVAEQVGLTASPASVVTGRQLAATGVGPDPMATPVYARVDPEQKLGLVRALQADGHVVAMTGDGVNDAAALRQADIGVALGAHGSDVAREAADMVITDDDLATIVAAVREGRGIYHNIHKVVGYLVTGNLAEVLVVLTGLLVISELGVPLLPLQLLWINLLTDGFCAIALGLDPPGAALMTHPPRRRDARLLAWSQVRALVGPAVLIAATALAALLASRVLLDAPWADARTVLFTSLVLIRLGYAFVVRRGVRLLGNRRLIAAVTAGLAAQALIVTWPPAQRLFSTSTLDPAQWTLVAAAGIIPILLLLAWPGRTPIRTDNPQLVSDV
jgi:P-type Ca2+ transporter type 2C